MLKRKSFADLLEKLFSFIGLRPAEPRSFNSPKERSLSEKDLIHPHIPNGCEIIETKSHAQKMQEIRKRTDEHLEETRKWNRLTELTIGLSSLKNIDIILGENSDGPLIKKLEDEHDRLHLELLGWSRNNPPK